MKLNKQLRKGLLIVAAHLSICGYAQKIPVAYRLYDANGKEIQYEQMIKELAQPDVVFIGEIHNCPITHWLELKIIESLYAIHKNEMKVGMEMFETDNQLIVDEYMQSVISPERFEEEARLWTNYNTDYEPIVYFLKENRIPLIATNVPRRYANVVKNKGLGYLDSLSEAAKKYLPPLPISYIPNSQAAKGFALMEMMGHKKDTNTEWIAMAQAIKDATMGWNIARNISRKFVHINGNFHSDNNSGIIPYLLKYRPGTTIKTIKAVRQESTDSLETEYKGLADYYICIPEDMSMSY